MPDCEVVVFGAAHIDLEARLEAIFLAGTSNPVRVRRTLGGVGANVALACCRSATTTLCTITGSDADGDAIAGTLRDAGIIVDIILSTASSGFYLALLDKAGNLQHGLANTQIMELADRENLSASLDRCKDAQIVAFDCNLGSQAIDSICDCCSAGAVRPRLAAVTVSPVKTGKLREVAEKLDFLFTNREELAILTDASANLPLVELAERAHGMGIKNVIATDSNAPLVVITPSVSQRISIPVKPDSGRGSGGSVNGAGDTLAGAVIAELAKGTDVVTAIKQKGLPATLTLLGNGKPEI